MSRAPTSDTVDLTGMMEICSMEDTHPASHIPGDSALAEAASRPNPRTGDGKPEIKTSLAFFRDEEGIPRLGVEVDTENRSYTELHLNWSGDQRDQAEFRKQVLSTRRGIEELFRATQRSAAKHGPMPFTHQNIGKVLDDALVECQKQCTEVEYSSKPIGSDWVQAWQSWLKVDLSTQKAAEEISWFGLPLPDGREPRSPKTYKISIHSDTGQKRTYVADLSEFNWRRSPVNVDAYTAALNIMTAFLLDLGTIVTVRERMDNSAEKDSLDDGDKSEMLFMDFGADIYLQTRLKQGLSKVKGVDVGVDYSFIRGPESGPSVVSLIESDPECDDEEVFCVEVNDGQYTLTPTAPIVADEDEMMGDDEDMSMTGQNEEASAARPTKFADTAGKWKQVFSRLKIPDDYEPWFEKEAGGSAAPGNEGEA